MPNRGSMAVVIFRRAQHEYRPIEDRRAASELYRILEEAATAAQHVFAVTVADEEPALLTIEQAGDMTLYRIRDDLQLERISFGRLTGGVLHEAVLLAETNDSDAGTTEVTYSNPALAAVGGHIRIRYRPAPPKDEAELVRTSLLPLCGPR
jgi:hypothetical protein